MKIYTARRSLTSGEKEAWGQHNMGMAEYFDRNFTGAESYLRAVLKILPDDPVAPLILERAHEYAASPPPSAWDGAELSRAS